MATSAASSNNSAQSSLHANIIPSEVGWQFVPQYYMFVNKQPQKLHCFYTKSSTFIHGTEGEDGKPCFGQQEIHNKIISIGFQDCKVFIHSVDAQSSANGGIIIQVIGEMSNRGEPWRKFAQTFFLAPQPSGYFVLNDIFRFLKEESVEDEETEQTETVSPPAQVAQENTVEPAAPGVQAGHPTVAAAPFDAALPSHLQSQLKLGVFEANEVVVMEEKKPTVNGYHAPEPEPEIAPIPQAEPIKQAPVVEPTPPQPAEVQRPVTPQIAPKPAPSPSPVPTSPAISAAPSPAQPPATSVQPPAPAQSVTPPPPPSAATVVAKPTVAQQAPGPAVSKPAPKTWANLAAANSNKWGTQVAQDAKGVSAAAPAPAAPPPAPSVPAHSKTEHRGGDRESRDVHPAYQAALNVSTPQCYIKSVSEAVSHQALFNVLSSRFGPVKDLDIVRPKACAFVEFTTLDAARKAIITSLSHNAGGEGGIKIDLEGGGYTRINVETRKERSERTALRPRPGGQGQQGHGQSQSQERGGGGSGGGGSGFRGGGSRGGRGAGRGAGGKP
ncbi:hypothetical protein Clacol_009114 [Clathrus columnatus]|uniref:Uncharacterized protein n=1 Tax=Clathrus columnatus TaxID=1419009 RepID=A0AAV5APM8_9AGAM|nr:hypothetical protein Clacol_009114 [Clathrus columnatus]